MCVTRFSSKGDETAQCVATRRHKAATGADRKELHAGFAILFYLNIGDSLVEYDCKHHDVDQNKYGHGLPPRKGQRKLNKHEEFNKYEHGEDISSA
jgi:hypothetical protein